jgi:hypothetical protein
MKLTFQYGIFRAVYRLLVALAWLNSAIVSSNELIQHACAHETGTGSRAHENAVDRLKGRYLITLS